MIKRLFLLVLPVIVGLGVITGILAPRFLPKLNRPRPVTILLYNHISPNFPGVKPFWERYYYLSTISFDQQMSLIQKRGFTVLNFDQYSNILLNKQARPTNALLILFRDANADIETDALPILEKYHFPAIVFYQPLSFGKPGFLTHEQIQHLKGNDITVAIADFTILDDPGTRQEVSGVIKQAQFEDLLPPVQHDSIIFAVLTGLIAASVALLSLISPRTSLFLVPLLLPTYLIRLTLFGIPATFLEVIVLAIIGPQVLRFGKALAKALLHFPYLVQMVLLVIAAGVSTYFAHDKMAALGGLKAFIIEPMLFGYLVYFWSSKWKMENGKWKIALPLFSAYSLTASFISLVVLKNYLLGNAYINFKLEKLTTYFGNPNYLATYLTIAIVFAVYLLLLHPGKYWKWFGTVTLVLTLPSFVLAKSDMGTLGVLTASGLLLLYRLQSRSVARRFRNLPTAFTVFAVMAGFLLFLLVSNPRIIPVFEKWHLQTLVSRNCIYKTGLQIAKVNPVFGVGLLNFNRAYLEMVSVSCPEQNVALGHNTLLDFWTQLGILGAAAYIWIIVRYVRLTLGNQDQPLAKLLLAMLLVLLVHGALDSQYHKNDYAVIWWTLIGLSAALPSISLNDIKNQSPKRKMTI